MKVMLRRGSGDQLIVYVAKKDLEEEVVNETELNGNTILTLTNGWELEINDLIASLKLPKTLEAKRLA